MNSSQYADYATKTLMIGGSKVLVIGVTVLVGYLLFIKLPFWFFRQTLKDVRKEAEAAPELPKVTSQEKVLSLEEKIRRDNEELKKEQKKKEQKKEQKKEEPKREPPKRPVPEPHLSPEAVFDLRPGEKLSVGELKSRYHDLLKQSHPDRVASMGPEFKKLAEKKTKEINDAYAKLKRKAS